MRFLVSQSVMYEINKRITVGLG